MRWLIRTYSLRAGSTSYSDSIHEGGTLTIGRGTDQAIFVADLHAALEHARITPSRGNRFRLQSMIATGVRVDGKLQQQANIGPGSEIDIGDLRIRLAKAPKGYDAAVIVRPREQTATRGESRYKHALKGLDATRLSKRGTAWALFFVLLVVGLGLPLAGYFAPEFGSAARATALPSDALWESGTLASAHHFFGEDCGACHAAPFQRASDEACVDCHQTTLAHATPELSAVSELDDTRCATCHRDHNGPDGIVRQDQGLCEACHVALDQTTAGKTLLANVGDFSTAHPQFQVELAAWDENDRFVPQRVSLADGLSEQSNLKFPHDKHMNPEGLNTPVGTKVLGCGDCHQTEPGGGKMVAVDFETMCQSCHALTFDPLAPERQVPHARVAEILFMLDEFYANRALQGGYEDITAPAIVRTRRRPGQRLTTSERQEALVWARGKAARVGEDLFEGQACGVCHKVSRREAETAAARWHIAPVRVAGEWYAKASFSHASHETMQCADCHDAVTSTTSDDVLIPGIDNCRQCHGGESAQGVVASTCISCHGFHQLEGQTMMASARQHGEKMRASQGGN